MVQELFLSVVAQILLMVIVIVLATVVVVGGRRGDNKARGGIVAMTHDPGLLLDIGRNSTPLWPSACRGRWDGSREMDVKASTARGIVLTGPIFLWASPIDAAGVRSGLVNVLIGREQRAGGVATGCGWEKKKKREAVQERLSLGQESFSKDEKYLGLYLETTLATTAITREYFSLFVFRFSFGRQSLCQSTKFS